MYKFRLIYGKKDNKQNEKNEDSNKDENKVKLFDNDFFRFQNRKYKMIINNKLLDLVKEYEIRENDRQNLKVKVISFSEILSLKFMFSECHLVSFIVIPSIEDNLKNEPKNALNTDTNNPSIKDIQTINAPDYNRLKDFYSTEDQNVTKKKCSPLAKKSSHYKKYLNLIYLMPNKHKNFSLIEKDIIINSLCYKSSLSSEEISNDKDDASSSITESFSSISTITKKDDINNITQDLIKLNIKLTKSLNNLIKNKDVSISNLRFMFYDCSSLVYISGISRWDISKCTDISGLFEKCASLESIPDISNWNTQNIQIAARIFSGCSALKSLPDISKWKMNNVNDIRYIFKGCSNLKSLPDISKWNTSKVTNMSDLFSECTILESLPDISKWNVANVKRIPFLFSKCRNLRSIPDLSKWKPDKIIDINNLFNGCSFINSIPDISNWNTNKVINMSFIFNECKYLETLPDISKWNTSKVKNMSYIFSGCLYLKSLPDISGWDTKQVTNLSYMFNKCSSLSSLPNITKWNTENVKNMSYIFSECESLKLIIGILVMSQI